VSVRARAFEHWDTASSTWTAEPGAYELQVGRASDNLPLRATVDVS
jgi:hypothetical protein